MDVKRLVIGTIVGAITLFVFGWLFFDMILAGFYEENMGMAGIDRESQILWSLVVGNILFALLIAIVFELQPRPKSIASGVLTGFVVGLLHWGSTDFTLYAIVDLMTLQATFVDPVVEGIHAAIAGGFMAAVLGKMDGKPHMAA